MPGLLLERLINYSDAFMQPGLPQAPVPLPDHQWLSLAWSTPAVRAVLAVIPIVARPGRARSYARVRAQHPGPSRTTAAGLVPPAAHSRLAMQHGEICTHHC